MSFRTRRAAVSELKAAAKALSALIDETDQTPRWWAANRRVDEALRNPALPARQRDPQED